MFSTSAECSADYDLRGAFALCHALTSVIKGVASLANDQLDECLQRCWRVHAPWRMAQSFAFTRRVQRYFRAHVLPLRRGVVWLWGLLSGGRVGGTRQEMGGPEYRTPLHAPVHKKACTVSVLSVLQVRGVCTLMAGVVQLLQHSFPKGVWNVLRSWGWIKCCNDAINYQGKEAEVVRSSALLTLGVFNLLISLLPASLMRAAAWVSGLSGQREAALAMLKTCCEEDGLLAPFGGLIWCVRSDGCRWLCSAQQAPTVCRLLAVCPTAWRVGVRYTTYVPSAGADGGCRRHVVACTLRVAVGFRVAYHVDTKTFVGERQTAEDFEQCERLFDWVRPPTQYAVQSSVPDAKQRVYE